MKKLLLIGLCMIVLLVSIVSAAPAIYPASNPFSAQILWDLDDNCVDDINDTDCTLSGDGCTYTTITPFGAGKSAFCDGTENAMLTSNFKGISSGTPFTISLWWNQSGGIVDTKFWWAGTDAAGNLFGSFTHGALGYQFDVSGEAANENQINGDGTEDAITADNQWHHLVWVNRNGALEFWIDGVNTSRTVNKAEGTSATKPAFVLMFFARNNNGDDDAQIAGHMDDILIFNQSALSPGQIITINNSNYTGGPPPVTAGGIDINITFPKVKSVFNGANISAENHNITINATHNESGGWTTTINDTDFTLCGNTSSQVYYCNNTALSEKSYHILITINKTGTQNGTNFTYFGIDTQTPTITPWFRPGANYTITNGSIYIVAQGNDDNCDFANLTITNSTNHVIAGNSSSCLGNTSFNMTYNFTFPYDDNFTFDVCFRDSVTASPLQPYYSYQKENRIWEWIKRLFNMDSSHSIDYYDSSENIDYSIVVEVIDGINKERTGYGITSSLEFDGKHMETIYEFDKPPSNDYKIRLTIMPNNAVSSIRYLTEYSNIPGHFVIGNKKYYHLQDAIDTGYKIDSVTPFEDGYQVILSYDWSKVKEARAILDPLSGGLNVFCEQREVQADGSPPTLTITAPANHSFVTTTEGILNITINGTATDNIPGNISTNDTRFTWNNTFGTWTLFNNTAIPEGEIHLIILANDSLNNTATKHLNITLDNTYPLMTITAPLNDTATNTHNITINGTATDTNGYNIYTNDTRFTWNNTFGTWTISNNTAVGNDLRITLEIYVNDSAGHINRNDMFFSLDNTAPIITITSPAPIPVGNISTITVTITESNPNMTTFYLYNSTHHITNFTYHNGTLTHNFTGLNNSIYYVNATHTDDVNNTAVSNTITLYHFFVDNCTSLSTRAINFTVYDEENDSTIRADISGTFNYSIGDVYKIYNLNMPDTSNFSICIFPDNITLSATYSIYYSGDVHPQRRYYENDGVLDNLTDKVSLYLLHSSLGIYTRFRVVDSFNHPISAVNIKMRRSILGVLTTIEQENTDDSGLATFWVNPNKDYIFTFVRTGYVTQSFTLRPTSSEIYEITLESEEEAEASSYSRGIIYSFLPKDDVLNNDTNYTFMFNMTSSHWDITGCTLYIKNDTDTLAQSSSSYTTSTCNIAISHNTGNNSIIISETIYELNNTVNISVHPQYAVTHTYVGDFSLKNFLDDLTAFGGAGFNDFTRMFIAFIVIFAILTYASTKMGLRDPEALIILMIALVWFFSYVGWFTLNYSSIPTAWLKKYMIAVLILLGGGAYLIKRQTD